MRAMQLTSTSPAATPAGLGTVKVEAAVLLVAWLTDLRTIVLPPGSPVVMVQVCVAAVASVLPAGSVAHTEKLWEPAANPV